MSGPVQEGAQLVAGEILSRDEFMRRWEALPLLKWAELLRGVVYLRGRVTWRRGVLLSDLAGWSGTYRAAIPQCKAALNATWLVNDENVTQPFVSVRIAPKCGGQSWNEGEFAGGAPEFAAEAFDADKLAEMSLKVDIYQEAGVREYVAVLLEDQEVRWHELQAGKFVVLPPPADGIYRSKVFPGLWLDAAALLAGDSAKVLAVLNDGLSTPEHQAFVAKLAQRAGRT